MILLYHLIFPDSTPKDTWNAGKVLRLADFKRHMRWLKTRFKIVPLEAYIANKAWENRTTQIAITFDDGYRRTFDLISPVLREEKVPATFFVNTSHLEDGALLWFVYFNALCFEKSYPEINIEGSVYPLKTQRQSAVAWKRLVSLARDSGDAIAFSEAFSKKYPLPDAIVQNYLGLRRDQIKNFGYESNLELGGHTHHHPYLDQISAEDQLDEMLMNKRLLEEISGNNIRFFAYPGGVYDHSSIDAARQAGFQAACAVGPKQIGADPEFELPRTDVYSPLLLALRAKLMGLADLLSRMGLRDA